MKATVYPGKCSGKVVIPPSKSMAHRAIICASLADGISTISNVAFSDDIIATIGAMKALGATIEENGDTLTITGINSSISNVSNEVDAHESGSTLRFIIPIFSLSNQRITFKGRNRLLYRPQGIYKTMFEDQGLFFSQDTSELVIEGALKPQTYTIDGSISSQFISGLLFTLPLLDGDSTIKILPPFESESYVNLTIELLSLFGIVINRIDELTYVVKGNQKYKANSYRVEGDYSQLAFHAVLAALNNDLELDGISHNSLQGDKAIIDILKECGVNIEETPTGYVIHKSNIDSTTVDLADCPDLGPILCVLGCFADEFHITNCNRLRIKESDRIAAMENALRPVGSNIASDTNNITIMKNAPYHGNVTVDGAKDHRIVMSMSVMATLLDTPLTITNAEAINKSYPNFFEDIQKLGIEVHLSDD